MSKQIRIRFDGPPSHEAGRFIEVEDETGKSIGFGNWTKDTESENWFLVLDDTAAARADERRLCCAAVCEWCDGPNVPKRNVRSPVWTHELWEGRNEECLAWQIHEMHRNRARDARKDAA